MPYRLICIRFRFLHTVHHFLKQLDAYREIQLREKQQLECLPAQDSSTPGFREKQKSAELQYCHLGGNVGVFYNFYIQRTEDTYKNLCFHLQVKLQPMETVFKQGCQGVKNGNTTRIPPSRYSFWDLWHLLPKVSLLTSLRKLDGSSRSSDWRWKSTGASSPCGVASPLPWSPLFVMTELEGAKKLSVTSRLLVTV